MDPRCLPQTVPGIPGRQVQKVKHHGIKDDLADRNNSMQVLLLEGLQHLPKVRDQQLILGLLAKHQSLK